MDKKCVARKVAPKLSSQLVIWKWKPQSWLLDRRLGILNNNYFCLQWELLFLTNEVMKWKEMIAFLENQLSCIPHNSVAERTGNKKGFQGLINEYNEQMKENNLVISILKGRPRFSSFSMYLCDEVYSNLTLAVAELDSLIIISFISLVFLWVSIEV
ncbi:Csm4p SKDI_16G0780 [Saccharomyces kudriavzevii IFO 1802]|uniref:CSM4-like protein n=2 Tax=Saccharomyces kudriavzevii (strain ATCC MYA-4449 / AS 2.2408 / CBS 8840 / NBRC 1802 / NCYC 2889) TaxID=226230 RepID=J5PRB9_SACK1|nr:uncharacterized protein SKDI_16G0780 [Saccharomyces kudriavzevii IFO 1802]EJT43558.1 CSM4-like protein [Saccharomyces kudriavzevii IFO 1802]CAI4052889.1 hypothetical protein SKDI_16G0780 [Saccharomyces kudriavzevii IFO 1802]